MKSLRLIPSKTSVQFIKRRYISFCLSIVFLCIGIFSLATQGLNLGIDFKGGTLIEAAQEQSVDISALRNRLNDLGVGDVQIQSFGNENDVLIRLAGDSEDAAANLKAVETIRSDLESQFEIRRVEVVGPQISGELISAGILAVTLAIAAMLIYIWFRFEWQFSLGSVIALTHDVAATIGIFSLLQLEFNTSILAAILTIVGYSMNDTVVVYDRVRENLRKYKKMDLAELLDLSINDTLSRTTVTSVTTLLALFALFFLGGEVIHGFAFAMLWGVFVGTYSSIFIAAPLLLILGVKRDWSGNIKQTD